MSEFAELILNRASVPLYKVTKIPSEALSLAPASALYACQYEDGRHLWAESKVKAQEGRSVY
jgi:hypothetical protein